MKKIYFLLFLIFILFSGGGYILNSKGFFNVRSISVSGATTTEEKEIISFFKQHEAQTNFFLIKQNAFIPKGAPAIKKITIIKDFLKRNIKLQVEERTAIGISCFSQENMCFYFDDQGILFAEAPRIQGGKLLIFSLDAEKQKKLGDMVILSRFLPALMYFATHPPKNIFFNKIIIDEANQEIRGIISRSNGTLFLSLRFSPKEPLLALEKLLETKKPDPLKLSTLDFRIENRFYFR